MARLLTDDEVVKFLRSLRYDPQYRQRDRRVPLGSLLKYIGVSRQTAYEIMLNRTAVSERLRVKFSQGYDLVERGLRFTRRKRAWAPDNHFRAVAELPPSPYALVPSEMEPDRGHPHMGVSQQALPEPVRRRSGLPPVPKVRWHQGKVVTKTVRHHRTTYEARGQASGELGVGLRPKKFQKSRHWRKQHAAAKRARAVTLRALRRARNARLEG
jgi:hypothetical protein